jgi:hypothetical protein
MIFKGSGSIYEQITKDRRSLSRRMPKLLQKALVVGWENRYEELYEPNGTLLLEDALNQVLNSFQGGNHLLSQLRCVWMALTLAVVVEPTVKYYQPDSSIPEEAIKRLKEWFLKTLIQILDPNKQLNGGFENIESITSVDFNSLLSIQNVQNVSSFQVLSEALNVYINAVKTLEPDHSLEALLNILDDCLEGYAIFPGSYGRRELFNWWLLDVVPSCWYLIPPDPAYLLNQNDVKIVDQDSSFKKLDEISQFAWSLIENAMQNRHTIENIIQNRSENTLFVSNDETEVQNINQLFLSGNKKQY